MITIAALVAVLAVGSLRAADPVSLLTAQTPTLEAARDQALAWLTAIGKNEGVTRAAFDGLWQPGDRPILDRIADTLALGNADAARLLAEARDPNAPAPLELPDLIRDKKQPIFFRANLALAYAKVLSGRRVFESSLAALRTVKASEVIDPAVYHYHRAVAEYALRLRDDARRSVARLGDVSNAPERYRALAELMRQNMNGWKDRDLGWIADSMGNIGRRLDLGWGGPTTRKMQRDVIAALDDLIRELEPPPPPFGPPGDPGDDPSPPGPPRPGPWQPIPGPDGPRPPVTGSGIVTDQELANQAKNWGSLPPKQRASVMAQLARTLPGSQRQELEDYSKKLGRIDR
jgi:hypothetical protein